MISFCIVCEADAGCCSQIQRSLLLALALLPDSTQESVLRIHTFGGLSIRDSEGKPLVGAAAQPRRLAILALLARAGDRGMSRDKILSLLWPDADDERGPRSLAQALYALRKELGAEEVIAGSKELRLDPGLASTDIGDFASAVARSDDARAVALYQGPFLDGFHLPGAGDFSRWVETERAALAHDYMRSLEALARASTAKGSASEAVNWWRKITALDPLNARYTMGLMEALVASGDRAGAIKQAHVYHLLVEQELDLPPDRDVMTLAERLRSAADAPAPATQVAGAEPTMAHRESPNGPGASSVPVVAPAATAPDERIVRGNARAWPQNRAAAVGVVALLVLIAVAGYAMVRGRSDTRAADGRRKDGGDAGPVVAVGQIVAYGSDSTAKALAGPVSDLLATSLARTPGLRVVSRGRLLELMRPAPGGTLDTTAGGFVDAARRAGGTEILDGTVYSRPGGTLRLDLRRVDLATGAIGDVHTVEGTDLFALVDSGTARIVAALGARSPAGSVADVTTRSEAAYRMYEQGIRAYFRGDYRTAHAFFAGATAQDSLFALATYQSAITSHDEPDSIPVRLERAKRLAARASDRERLTILAKWAYTVSSPSMQQVAETLVTRYPTEVEGYLYTGIARAYAGDFLGGIAQLERAIAMDSLGARNDRPSCASCEALRWLVSAYQLADSFPAAEREARRWIRLQPGSSQATRALSEVFEAEGRPAAADSIVRSTATADPAYDDVLTFRAIHLIRAGDYDTADRLLLAKTREPVPARQIEAYWQLALSLREQGRLMEALDATRYGRMLTAGLGRSKFAPPDPIEGQIQLESRRPGIAAALFDSIAQRAARQPTSSQIARGSAWMLTQVATARAAAGDTAALTKLADSIRVLGAGSFFGRDRRLFHHVRGLLLAARGDDDAAIAEFQAAIYSVPSGYTRTNVELARLFMRDNRPRDAVAVLQPIFRGSLDASNLYVNRIEAHELLAQAWDAARVRDSAAAHYSVVARVWASGDPLFRARGDSAKRRIASLGAR